jgi:hypothetical protein
LPGCFVLFFGYQQAPLTCGRPLGHLAAHAPVPTSRSWPSGQASDPGSGRLGGKLGEGPAGLGSVAPHRVAVVGVPFAHCGVHMRKTVSGSWPCGHAPACGGGGTGGTGEGAAPPIATSSVAASRKNRCTIASEIQA